MVAHVLDLGGLQISCPEPTGQRKLEMMHHWCPAVIEAWRSRPADGKSPSWFTSCQAELPPQPGETNPSGQRRGKIVSATASSPKHCWNSIEERAKSVIMAPGWFLFE